MTTTTVPPVVTDDTPAEALPGPSPDYLRICDEVSVFLTARGPVKVAHVFGMPVAPEFAELPPRLQWTVVALLLVLFGVASFTLAYLGVLPVGGR